MQAGVSPDSVSGGALCPAALLSRPGLAGGEAGAGDPAEHGCSYQVSASTLLPTPCHKAKPDLEGSASSPFGLCIRVHVRDVRMKHLTRFFSDRVRGHFAGNHRQAHLGHSLMPPPAAALGAPQSWREPCTAPPSAGQGGPLPSAGPLSTALPRRPWKRASLLAASPSAPRPPQTCKPACSAGTKGGRSALSWEAGGGALSGRYWLALVLRSCLPR